MPEYKTMKNLEEQTHLAAQYLAAAGISFLTKKPDDSHTNLGFISDSGEIETHPLSEDNDKLFLNYNTFSLEWKSNSVNTVFKLDGATPVSYTHLTLPTTPYV